MNEKELHTHGADCGCAHDHHHHDDGCGCGHDHAHEQIDKKAFLRKFAPGLFFFLLGAAVEHLIPGSESSTLWHYVELAAFALSYLFVGFSILREAVEGVLAKNIFNENLLMAIASLGALPLGSIPRAAPWCCCIPWASFCKVWRCKKAAVPLKICWSKSRIPCVCRPLTA